MTMVVIEPMREEHAAETAAMLRDSFAPSVRPFLAYAQHGTAAFLASDLGRGDDRSRLVAIDGAGAVVGFAEFRIDPVETSTVHLGYLAVHESARRRGVATKLLDAVGRRAGEAAVALEVFADNRVAVALYEALGFERDVSGAWASRAIDARPSADDVGLSLPSSGLERHGFTAGLASWHDDSLSIGLIGRDVVRVPPAHLGDDALLRALRASRPSLRRAFAIVPTAEIERLPADARLEVSTIRMRGHLQPDGRWAR
ncbi:MAG: GNAT family N-acetyltransferase [Agromyces sp.]